MLLLLLTTLAVTAASASTPGTSAADVMFWIGMGPGDASWNKTAQVSDISLLWLYLFFLPFFSFFFSVFLERGVVLICRGYADDVMELKRRPLIFLCRNGGAPLAVLMIQGLQKTGQPSPSRHFKSHTSSILLPVLPRWCKLLSRRGAATRPQASPRFCHCESWARSSYQSY